MLLKKQTVWLLTMLSLVVVLSVYYVTTPEQPATNMAATEQKEDNKKETDQASKAKEDSGQAKAVVTPANDEMFEALRMEITDDRNKLMEELTVMMANTELSAEQRNEAHEKIKQLTELNTKEGILETLIVSMGYDAALVRADGHDVRVTVKADKPSASAANDIIQLVGKEINGMQNVVVEFQPKK
ncbi:SpoIIIAH-like family protein [Peribacillus tepidiphilus]|uniref:SpoIIIAH-like family protein n=1 Tax=Peribacillus tepidiphilus TaxID=2652445 RepID=UPI001290AEB8|nr:SpoIIIAH-like family protein [Peribacillus tepidiphilus]